MGGREAAHASLICDSFHHMSSVKEEPGSREALHWSTVEEKWRWRLIKKDSGWVRQDRSMLDLAGVFREG